MQLAPEISITIQQTSFLSVMMTFTVLAAVFFMATAGLVEEVDALGVGVIIVTVFSLQSKLLSVAT